MRFTLSQLYSNNESKPFVRVARSNYEDDLQWEECDLEDMPPRVTGVSMHDMGKTSIVPYEELPKTFKATDGNEYLIEDIHTTWGNNK